MPPPPPSAGRPPSLLVLVLSISVVEVRRFENALFTGSFSIRLVGELPDVMSASEGEEGDHGKGRLRESYSINQTKCGGRGQKIRKFCGHHIWKLPNDKGSSIDALCFEVESETH